MSDDLAPRLQRSLGDAFALGRELGGGGMARVFLATDRALDRQVVVKVLDLEGAIAASTERFRREIKLIAQLQHPHIVPVLTAGGDDTLLWYAMPYVAGESLRARLVREGALPLADALRIARELLDALAFAHEHGVVHRDVKPENILLEGRHAVVADFGVAKALADAGVSGGGLTSVGLALGTPAYMAPEQAMADPTTNHRADLYAAGAVLYEMLAGAPPFSGNAQAIVAAHLTTPAPRIEERRNDVPASVASLILRLMAKNPAERPQSAHEVAVALEAVTTPGGSGVMAAATTPVPRATPTTARGSRRRPLIAAAVITIAAVAGLYLKSRADAAPVVEGADIIAVMPFGSTGDSTLGRLGRDLVVTLSANLDGVGSLRAVDAMTVLQRAQTLPQPVSLEAASHLAKELGARSVLHGSIVREGSEVRVTAGLYGVDGGEPLARFSIPGSPDSLRLLTDSVTASILRDVWRRGTPPSPLLSAVTTANGEALRAFLEGERLFGANDIPGAIASYTRAVSADSMFAQAWLRIDYSRTLSLQPVDTAVRRHVRTLRARLPDRDGELFDVRSSTGIPTVVRIDSGRVLATRYPDYHTAQYQVGDNIIHGGPIVGVPITEALPYLHRLEVLAPNHADNAQHRMMYYMVTGDTAEMVKAAGDFRARTSREGFGAIADAWFRGLEARRAGRDVPMDSLLASARRLARLGEANPALLWLPGLFWPTFATPSQTAEFFAAAKRADLLGSRSAPLDFGIGVQAVGRGRVSEGVRQLETLVAAPTDIPDAVRLTAARVAAQSAWLGTLPVADADAVIQRTRAAGLKLEGTDVMELSWVEAVVAIAASDSARFSRALAELRDTTAISRSAVRNLRGLWRERRTGQVDSLIASEEEAMARSSTFSSMMPLARTAIGRALVKDGDPVRAERYLQWTDALSSTPRTVFVQTTMMPLVSYERGLAREAAGDRHGAILHLQRFVEFFDSPPPSMQQQHEDAKARLRRLISQDR